MKKINVTFSIPSETHKLLHSLVGRRKMSLFVTKAIHKALESEAKELRKAYAAAEDDSDRLNTIKDWQTIETEDWE